MALCSLLLCLPVAAEELHLSAEQLTTHAGTQQLELSGQVRLLAGDFHLLAAQAFWDRASQFLSAQQAELQAPDWQLQAAQLELSLPRQQLEARRGQLRARGWVLSFAHASLNPWGWQLQEVSLAVPGLPGRVTVRHLTLYPTVPQDNLQLLGLQWLGLSLPVLQLSFPLELPDGEQPPEVRSDPGWFSPRVNLVEGGLALGATSRLYQDASQRVYARLDYHPLQGWLSGVSHEWRQAGVLQSELLRLESERQPWRGHLQWQGALGPGVLRSGLHLQESSGLLGSLWLPAPRNSLQALAWHSDHLYLSDWWSGPGLRLRALGALQFGAEGWLGGVATQIISQPWRLSPTLAFQASGTLTALGRQTGSIPAGHLGGSLRLLGEWQPAPGWVWGLYAEQYHSSLPADFFARPEALEPRSGSYLIWQLSPQMALGTRLEWRLPAQGLAVAEGMFTLREGVWTLNVLAEGIPPGLQVQVHTSWF